MEKLLENELTNWTMSTETLCEIQKKYSKYVIKKNCIKNLNYIAGADCSYKENKSKCAIVVMRYPDLTIVDKSIIIRSTNSRYIPEFFALREAPLIIECWKNVKIKPDCLIIHGHGIAHPRKFGLASHIGIILNIPTFGCAENLLYGKIQQQNNNHIKYILDENTQIIGALIQTKIKAKPVIISIGHKISLIKAIEFALNCIKISKLPEPLRIAHLLSKLN